MSCFVLYFLLIYNFAVVWTLASLEGKTVAEPLFLYTCVLQWLCWTWRKGSYTSRHFQSSFKAVQVSLRYPESIWDKTADTFNLTAQPRVSVRVKKFTDVSRRIISQQFYLASLFCSPVRVWTIIYGWWTAKHKKLKIIMARPAGAKCGDKSAESWLASFTLLAADTSDPSNTRQQLESPQHPSFHNRGGGLVCVSACTRVRACKAVLSTGFSGQTFGPLASFLDINIFCTR